jgi:hypothetical protein
MHEEDNEQWERWRDDNGHQEGCQGSLGTIMEGTKEDNKAIGKDT